MEMEIQEMKKNAKKSFLDHYLQKQLRLSRRQREYKKIVSSKLQTREEKIAEQGYHNTICQMQQEKDSLRAEIWVAGGTVHERTNKQALDYVGCQIKCQEQLGEEIRTMEDHIGNVQHQLDRVNKQIYELNRRTIPDAMHQAHVAKMCKVVQILEDQFEVTVQREGTSAARNAQLRKELLGFVHQRAYFNDKYTKLVEKLNSDRKYIVELIEYAIHFYDTSIEVYEKISNLVNKDAKEFRVLKIEMQNLVLKTTIERESNKFLSCKGNYRPLADLQPKEYRRREAFRQKHRRKINLYKIVLQKVLEFFQTDSVAEVVQKYQDQESMYYSFFNYANELSYHMTLLNNSVNRLFSEIKDLKYNNHDTLLNQLEAIDQLEDSLKEKKKYNEDLRKQNDLSEKLLQKLLKGVQEIKDLSNADTTQLTALLGDFSSVNKKNVRNFLKILEKDVFKIISCIYHLEREDRKKTARDYLVREFDPRNEFITPLDDIVPTQQCPECAEGEVNEDEEDRIVVQPMADIMKKLFEKVHQPEMQYRLHSLSQCRLPRSRFLTGKRFM